MFDLKDKTLTCARSGCDGRYDWISVYGCYECPICGMVEWGPPRRKVTTAEARMVYRLQLAYVDTLRKHGGGSRAAGRKRKDRQHHFNPNVDGMQPGVRDYYTVKKWEGS